MRVELRIEALILDGFPAMDYGRCAAALREELTRLVSERGVPAAWRESWRSDSHALGPLEVPRGAEPEWVGVQLARQLYDGLRPAAPGPDVPRAGRADHTAPGRQSFER